MQGQILTRTILAWDLTGLAQSLAYINLVVAVPMIFASMIGGAITDRVERRQLIIIGQSLITGNEIFILGLLVMGKLEFNITVVISKPSMSTRQTAALVLSMPDLSGP